MAPPEDRPLLDTLQRPLASLRLSVTDRCNLRCAYCMPEASYTWLPNPEILSFEELRALVDVFVALGVRKVRLTGGEPLLRRQLPRLIALLAQHRELELALTTNGVLLQEHAHALRNAGLHQLTISLDTLSQSRFQTLTKRDALPSVLAGIEAARAAGFSRLKFDTVLMRGVNDDEIEPLLDFASDQEAELRFIEYMDVGGATGWSMAQVLPARELLERIARHYGSIEPLSGRGSAPAQRYRLPHGQVFGIIASTTQPFCRTCDRARITADGRLFTCLYASEGVDLKGPLRAQISSAALTTVIANAWSARNDRAAEQRQQMRERRGVLATAEELRTKPHLEMHTKGG